MALKDKNDVLLNGSLLRNQYKESNIHKQRTAGYE